MGFPYGDGRYGMGRYSARPDWVPPPVVVDPPPQFWFVERCELPGWTPEPKEPPVWAPLKQTPDKLRRVPVW